MNNYQLISKRMNGSDVDLAANIVVQMLTAIVIVTDEHNAIGREIVMISLDKRVTVRNV